MGKPKKYFGTTAKIKGQLYARNAVYVVDVPPGLWENWIDMVSDLGIEHPAHLLEVHLDNYLRAKRRGSKDAIVDKISMEVAVDKNLLSTLNAVTEAQNKSQRDFMIYFMRNIYHRYKKKVDRYFDMLDKYDKEVDAVKKNRIKQRMEEYAKVNRIRTKTNEKSKSIL